jgi:hypothetical protein
VTVQRGEKRQTHEIEVRTYRPLVPGRHGHEAEYLISGGIVFQPLTIEYLLQWDDPPANLTMYALYDNVVTQERRQLIFIQKVLPHAVNQGYEDWEEYVVRTVNGVTPRDMTHLAEILDRAAGPWLKIVTEEHSVLTLDIGEARAAQTEILKSFGISRDRSLGVAPPDQE